MPFCSWMSLPWGPKSVPNESPSLIIDSEELIFDRKILFGFTEKHEYLHWGLLCSLGPIDRSDLKDRRLVEKLKQFVGCFLFF